MLTLGSAGLNFVNFPESSGDLVLRVTDQPNRPDVFRSHEAFLVANDDPPPGFGIYLTRKSNWKDGNRLPSSLRVVVLPQEYEYISDGDVVRIRPQRKAIRVLYRRNSPHNTFLVTERCNHYCLMCSQPPKDIDDSWIIDEILTALPLIDPATKEIGFSGGEPTLLGDDFIRILSATKAYLPTTSIHILSNGRRFADEGFTRKYASIRHPDMMVGIPIYSDVSTIHDYVVQADGAFDGTIRGVLNLKRYRQRVEIRVVIHKQTYERLPQLADFIIRNLTFVDHVALMGLEMTGFTKANLESLWVDPIDYQPELYRAATRLADSRVNVSIYNHQLCILDKRLWPLARKSISDWKNEYRPECAGCREMEKCGGFFSSAKLRYSSQIKPFT